SLPGSRTACSTGARSWTDRDTAADAADADPLAAFADVDDVAARQIRQARQNLATAGLELPVEPDEVLVIALDEDRGSRRCATLGEPGREVSRAVVLAYGLVYALGIWSDAEVADVK